jgi:hypothetical protein
MYSPFSRGIFCCGGVCICAFVGVSCQAAGPVGEAVFGLTKAQCACSDSALHSHYYDRTVREVGLSLWPVATYFARNKVLMQLIVVARWHRGTVEHLLRVYYYFYVHALKHNALITHIFPLCKAGLPQRHPDTTNPALSAVYFSTRVHRVIIVY